MREEDLKAGNNELVGTDADENCWNAKKVFERAAAGDLLAESVLKTVS
jgi:hypothetical protein